MKRLFLMVLVILAVFPLSVHAESRMTGAYLPNSEAQEFYDNLSLAEAEVSEDLGQIVSFDVADEILLAFDTQKIAVCDLNGKIQKVFQFETYGSYYVEWFGGNIRIYFVRGSTLLEITKDGDLVMCMDVNCDRKTNEHAFQELRRKTKCETDEADYVVRKNGSPLAWLSGYRYSKLVKIDETGNETVLYDCSAQSVGRTIIWIILIVGFFLLCVLTALYQWKNHSNNRIR